MYIQSLLLILLTVTVTGNVTVDPIEGKSNETGSESVQDVTESSESLGMTVVEQESRNETDDAGIRVNLALSPEQLLRFRKFLNRKDFLVKTVDGFEERLRPVGFQMNRIGESVKEKFPDKLSDVTAEDILPLLPRNLSDLMPIVHELKNERCQRHVEFFLQELHTLKKWAVQMFDAGTKIPEGVLFGSSHHFGNFDECMNVEAELPVLNGKVDVLKGQYCLATVSLSGRVKESIESSPIYHLNESAWNILKVPTTRRGYRKDTIRWSICVPAACSHLEVQEFLNYAAFMSSIKGLQLSFEVPSNMCQVKREIVFDTLDILLGVVFITFFLIIGVATVFDVFFARKRKGDSGTGLYAKVLVCFSAYRNLIKLYSYTPSQYNLDSIFGIKAITMILILMGHATAFLIGGPSMNSNYKEEAVLKVENGILLNNPLLVDTFLMVGAFLLCRLLLAELDKRKFINPLVVYVARLVRLTPAYAVVIAIYCTWFYKIDSGPLWEAKVGLERERCLNSWWTNILYINNYVNSDHLCMFQSWYLAVDTQFFFLAPLIIYPLWKWPVYGEISLFVATVVSVIIPFAVTFVNELDPVLMMYSSEITDLSSNPMYKSAYIKTHMRGMSYTIGILLGYIIHRIQSSGIKIRKTVVWCGWIIAAFSSISAMFTVSVFYYKSYDAFESAAYAALHRVGWCVGIAWVIFACVTNNAGKLNSILTARGWVPISRLSYCAYLVNGLVELSTIGSLRHTRYLTNLEIAKETMSHIVLTYGLALFFSTVFEAPILSLESLLLKKATGGQSKKKAEASTGSTLSVESRSSADTATTNSNSGV